MKDVTRYFKEYLDKYTHLIDDHGQKLLCYNTDEFPNIKEISKTSGYDLSKLTIYAIEKALLTTKFRRKLNFGSVQLGKSKLIFVFSAWYHQEFTGIVHADVYSLDNMIHTTQDPDKVFMKCLENSPLKGEHFGEKMGIL